MPNSTDAVTINTTALETITHNGGSDTVYSLTVGNDIFELNGGSLATLHGASFANGFVQTGGAFTGGKVTIKGNSTLTGGAAEGATTLSVSGTAALANYLLGGSAVLRNAKAVNQTGQITIGDNTGVNAGIVNGAGATYAIAGDFGVGSGAASAAITNAGVFAKTAGNGTSVINVSFINTGTISVLAGGDLQFNGPSSVIGGVLTGGGIVSFAGSGGSTLTLGTATVGGIGLYSTATLNLAGAASILNGALYDQSNGSNQLLLGSGTFTINGTALFEGNYGTAYLQGSGGLALNGATTAYGADFGGSLQITNAGDFSVVGSGVTLGDNSGAIVGFTNSSTGTLQFTVDQGIGSGNSSACFITNNGLLEKTGGGGTSDLGVAVTNAAAATIDAVSGSIQIGDTLANTGTITGAGQVFVTGSATLSAGTVLSVAEFGIYNQGYVSVATSLTYGGILNDSSNGSDTLNLAGATLTLTGTQDLIGGNYGTAAVNGTGKLAVAKGGTLTIFGSDIGGTVGFTNSGAVNQTGTVQIGDGSGNVATVTNAKGATWTITNDSAITLGATNASSFLNAGTLTVDAGGGQSGLSTNFVNQTGGVINIASGSLGDNDLLSNAGTITGADFAINNSAHLTLTAGSSITTASFDLYSAAQIAVDTNQTYGGTFNDYSNGSDTIILNGANLHLTGSANFIGAYGSDIITGNGTLTASGGGSFGAVLIGGTADFTNNGTLLVTGGLQIGDGSGSAASFVNTAGGIYDIVNDSAGIGHGASLLSNFTNAGLFEKTAGSGTTVIGAAFTNNGTITVTSGTLEFTAGTLVNNGTINGVISTDQYGNVFITHH